MVDPPRWPVALPDFSKAALRQRVRIGAKEFSISVSPVQREVPGEPDTHLVHLAITLGGLPLTTSDLGIDTPDACSNLWAYLTNRVTETVVQFYAPRPRENGELNPRLGCWGPRPDLVSRGMAESDCALGVVLGVSIWLPTANPPVDDGLFLEAMRDTLIEALSYWVVVAQRTSMTDTRRN